MLAFHEAMLKSMSTFSPRSNITLLQTEIESLKRRNQEATGHSALLEAELFNLKQVSIIDRSKQCGVLGATTYLCMYIHFMIACFQTRDCLACRSCAALGKSWLL